MVDYGELGRAARDAVLMAATEVAHDGYVLGHGVRLSDGTVDIKGYEVGGTDKRIDAKFVEAYAPLAAMDMAAQAFANRMSQVLRIPMDHYRGLGKRTGYQLLGLFEPLGIEHLLLAGVESRYGLAWLTMYRTKGDERPAPEPFGLEDCEKAMFTIRGALYAWQRAFLPLCNEDVWGDFRFDIVKLSPSVLETALWRSRGYEYSEIAKKLGITKEAVKKHVEQAAEALEVAKVEVSKILLGRAMGPLPEPRPRKTTKGQRGKG